MKPSSITNLYRRLHLTRLFVAWIGINTKLPAIVLSVVVLVITFFVQALFHPVYAFGSQATDTKEDLVVIERSGRNDCTELPSPPEGVPGLREYARFDVTHDGSVTVRSAQLPFSRNEGFLYRLTQAGWVPNETDFILIRSALPVLGGYTYVITFGTGEDRCGAWSIEAVHPR